MSRKEQSVYEELIQWLEIHNGTMPRRQIKRDGKYLKAEEMSLEEKAEKNFASRCYNSKEYKAFKACEGIPIEDLPLRYKRYQEQIKALRKYGRKSTYEQVIEWLEAHDGKMPRSEIKRNGESLKTEEMSKEEKEETSLGSKWLDTREYKAFKACKGISIENLPPRYKKYKEKIAVLRDYERMRQEKIKAKAYKEIIEWLDTHNGIMPRISRLEEGKYLKSKDMSLEQRKERDLASRWYNSSAYRDFKACREIPIEELPLEYEPYKEQIATLRKYEQMRKERALERVMRRSVSKQASNNENTRSELIGISVQLEDDELQTE